MVTLQNRDIGRHITLIKQMESQTIPIHPIPPRIEPELNAMFMEAIKMSEQDQKAINGGLSILKIR